VPIIMGTGVDTWSSVSDTIEDRIRTLFASVEAQGFLDVREIGGSGSVSVDADAPVAAASVIKILLCLAFAREVAAGTIPAAERAEVPAAHRVGGAGTTGCRDPVQMSLRDLALFMMTTSDNAATDVILERTGRAAIDAVLDELNLSETHFRGGMMWGHMRVVEALGLPSARDLDDQIEGADQAAVWSLAWLDPKRSNASTARDITRLLEAIWTDGAGPPEACAFVRSAMAQQLTTHRLAAGFEQDGVRVAGKTGTLPAIRNEAGVVAYPDGRRYAAAVFTRAGSLSPRRPQIDGAIGTAARMAVEHLRRSP
jgi:beta-lactamase class A